MTTAIVVDIANDATDPSGLDDTDPGIAVNPTDPRQIAVVTRSENEGIPLAGEDPRLKFIPVWKSDDSGQTWRKVFQIREPQPGGAYDIGPQKIAFDSAGRLFAVTAGYTQGNILVHSFVHRQDGAPDAPLTWVRDKSLSDGSGTRLGDQVQLAVDKSEAGTCSNQIYSPWLREGLGFSDNKDQAMVSISADRGGTWTDLAVGDNSTFHNDTPRIALAPDGKAYLLYKTREAAVSPDSQRAHFLVARSDTCGLTWDALGQGGASVHGVTPVETLQTWRFFTVTAGSGATRQAHGSDAWIAVDPGDGDVYVAYISRDASGHFQIYVARSTDEGLTWASTRVTDGTRNSGFPVISVAENGTVGVLYIDWANSSSRHRFARSFDDGAHWNDQILQEEDTGFDVRLARSQGLRAFDNTFFGVFNGHSIGRAQSQRDPIFFRETAFSPGPFVAEGQLSLLRVHRVGTGFGPATDHLDVEVVVKLDTQPENAFGFQLRNDTNESAHSRMLDILRDAFNHDRRVRIEYIRTGLQNGRILRVMDIR